MRDEGMKDEWEMMNEERKPKEYDVVLGGNNPPLNALVLGGIEGIKQRFTKANSDDDKIVILREAIKYGEAGEDFLSDVFSASKGKIQWMAAAFISATNNETYNELLVDYFADFIQHNKQDWNNWRKEVKDIQIYLKRIEFKNLTVLKDRDFSNTNLINADLSYVDLTKCNFDNADLCQANLSGSYLQGTCFKNAKLVGANLYQAWLYEAELFKTDLRKTNLENTHFKNIKLTGIQSSIIDLIYDFEASLLKDIVFKNCSLQNKIFRDSVIEKVGFKNCNIENINFDSANLEQCIFDNCNLMNSYFSRCNFYSNGIKQNLFKNSNIENADFKFSNLRGFIFENVNLKGVDFRWCDLTGIDFTGLDVRGANFTRCTFGNNNLRLANTEGAKFSSIDSPRFPPRGLKIQNIKGALFDDRHYYESGYE